MADIEQNMKRGYVKVARALNHLTNTNGHRFDRLGNRILMRLSYEEYKDIWVTSGKWGQKGRTKTSYCMSRKDDIGHYEVGNVFIQLHGENVREKNLKYRATPETKQKMSASHKGMVGLIHSQATKDKISAKAKGRKGHWAGVIRGPASKESVEKNRQAQLARWSKIRQERQCQIA